MGSLKRGLVVALGVVCVWGGGGSAHRQDLSIKVNS